MFFGEFEYKIDEKGRVPFPPKFRRVLREGLMLAPGIDKCINVYPLAEWKKLSENLTGGPITPGKLRRLNRAMFATAFHMVLDNQGRIVLPITLRERAEIVDEVVIAGVNDYLEIWNPIHWGTEKEASLEQAWQITESLERH
jgi:MraZ protein